MFISIGFIGNRRIVHPIQYTVDRILLLHLYGAPRASYLSTGRYRLSLVLSIEIFSPFVDHNGRLNIDVVERRLLAILWQIYCVGSQ